MRNMYLPFKITVALFIAIMVLLPSGVTAQDLTFLPALQLYNSQGPGTFASGELRYIADGKGLGSESYKITKRPDGKVELTSEGVVTPPIPIPFIKPKIKYSQDIILSEALVPESLFLQYKGLLGIGSQKISVSVDGEDVLARIGNDEKNAVVDPEKSVFSGIGASQALFAFILSRRDGATQFTEIRSGGSGPQGADQELTIEIVEIALQEKTDRTIEVGDQTIQVSEYTFVEEDGGRVKSFLIKDGTFLALTSRGSENPFDYIYRSDLLGEDFRF